MYLYEISVVGVFQKNFVMMIIMMMMSLSRSHLDNYFLRSTVVFISINFLLFVPPSLHAF